MKLLPILASVLVLIAGLQWSAGGSIAENCRRFGSIVIHSVNFQKASPEDAVAFLNLNWRNTDPHVKGMDLKLAPGAFVGKTVTLAGKDMKFGEIVGRIAEQLNAVVIIQSDSILLKPNNGEQAGAGQPATSPESKPEGSDKPQPEAEGRSR